MHEPIHPPRTIPDRDELTLGQLMGIKAATGVDPLNPSDVAAGTAAMLWYAIRQEGREVDFLQLLAVPYSTIQRWIDDADTHADEEEAAAAEGPTGGSGTPGNASTSHSGTASHPETSEPAPSESSESSEPPTSTS